MTPRTAIVEQGDAIAPQGRTDPPGGVNWLPLARERAPGRRPSGARPLRDTHRVKKTRKLLEMVRRDHLSPGDLCYPMYVVESPRPGEVLPDVPYYTLDGCLAACEDLCRLGVPAVMIFDILDARDALGPRALDPDGFTARLYAAIKREFGDDLVVISDSGICTYRRDGSCIHRGEDGALRFDETRELVAQVALAHARFGADVIGLPEMVDGQVAATRSALDADGLGEVATLSMVKGDSVLFNPFARATKGAAAGGAAAPGWRHRNDPLNMNLFAQKIAAEVEEGVDVVAIKPASLYLDVVRLAAERHPVAVAAFQVSGEYLMLKLAARSGYFEEEELFAESAACLKRAGASLVITYQAPALARALRRTGREP